MTYQKLSIVGNGWLGRQIQKYWIENGGLCDGITSQDYNAVPKSFWAADIIMILIPFKRALENPRHYLDHFKALEPYLTKAEIILFTSSTSVYPDRKEMWHESDEFVPVTERAKVLKEAEDWVLSLSNTHRYVMRCAGLHGPGRDSSGYLKKGSVISEPNSPINLIHSEDLLSMIITIIEVKLSNGIYNAVCDHHPTRQSYFTHRARKLGVKSPQFEQSQKKGVGKKVSNAKIKTMMMSNLTYPDPMGFL